MENKNVEQRSETTNDVPLRNVVRYAFSMNYILQKRFFELNSSLVNIVPRINWHVLILLSCILLSTFTTVIGQNQNNQEEVQEIANSPIREELHRYIGYEDLLLRYYSLPFDITMNTNVHGDYLDIGFLLLLFLPLLFLFSNLKIVERISLLLALGLLLLFSIPTAYSSSMGISLTEIDTHITTALSNAQISTIDYFGLLLTQGVNTIFQPINKVISSISGQSDYITFPFMIVLFLLIVWLIHQSSLGTSKEGRGLLFFVAAYSFFWFILAAGIVWYGLLMIPLLLFLMMYGIQRINNKVLTTLFGTMAVAWLFMAFTSRGAAGIRPTTDDAAKGIVNVNNLLYNTGQLSNAAYLESFFPQCERAMQFLNQEQESLIYMAGTNLSFFIKKNDQRVINDPTLATFATLTQQFPDKAELAQALKTYGINFIVFDLNLHQVDRTPEKSLTKKYQQFLQFSYQNPQVQLVATDRVIVDKQGNRKYDVFGHITDRNARLESFGSFALYQLRK